MDLDQESRKANIDRPPGQWHHMQNPEWPVALCHGGTLNQDSQKWLSSIATKQATLALEEEEILVRVRHSCTPYDNMQTTMKSLLEQLLEGGKSKLSVDFLTAMQQHVESYDVKTLCLCFAKLVRQLRSSCSVFCIIDEIAVLEEGPGSDKTVNALRYLVYLAKMWPGEPFRLLLICAGESRLWRKYGIMEKGVEIEDVDEEVVADNVWARGGAKT